MSVWLGYGLLSNCWVIYQSTIPINVPQTDGDSPRGRTTLSAVPASVSVTIFPPYITESVWPVYHPVSFSFLPLPSPQSLSPFLLPSLLPSSPQHLHRTLCPGQPLIIFTHQNVDQLHFMRIENHKFCSAWTAPRLKSCFSLFRSHLRSLAKLTH